MPKEKQEKLLCDDRLRHTEYYGMQKVFDELYTRSRNGEHLTDLMSIILSRENILLAYRNIKTNVGSSTPGTDGFTIKDIGSLAPEEMVAKVKFIVQGSAHGYRPKPVRRKDIPKPHDPAKTRPLGIPCIWDRLIQQCIKQVMEPICEAKFSENSFGFRPNRSVEHAIAQTHKLMQNVHLHYVIEFDIKGFFDNVDHPKLIKQIWSMGIRDKHLIWIIKRILKAPIRMPDGKTEYPTKGTPQGGIISPLLANIVLNELDHWIESQWQKNPVTRKYCVTTNYNGSENFGAGFLAMKKTGLKEMYIVRYADDFRIFCRTRSAADKTKIAITQWLSERLKLEVSQEKTKVVNLKRRYSEFLGFKIKVWAKGKTEKGKSKYVIKGYMSDKNLKDKREKLVEQAKRIAQPSKGNTEGYEIWLYNSMVTGIQNYYRITPGINIDCASLNRTVMTVLTNRLRTEKGTRLRKKGRILTDFERIRYGKSSMLRYASVSEEPIYPIGYVQFKVPKSKARSICSYTSEGRIGIHDNLRINVPLMLEMMKQPLYDRSTDYADNRISLFSAQWGRCSVTGREFISLGDIHCHHIIPIGRGGTDRYENLTIVGTAIHSLIHETNITKINEYMSLLSLDKKQMSKLNNLRQRAGLREIA